MTIRTSEFRDVAKKHWILWAVLTVVVFLVTYFFVIPPEFGGSNKKWVQEYYAPYWSGVSKLVFVRRMTQLTNTAPKGLQAYCYFYDWRQRHLISLASTWDRGTPKFVIRTFYARVYTNAITSMVDGLNFLEERSRIDAINGYLGLDAAVKRIKRSIDLYQQKLNEIEKFKVESAVSNILQILSNQNLSLKKQKVLRKKRVQEIRKMYATLNKLDWKLYGVMADEMLNRPLQSKPSVWVFPGDLHTEQFENIQTWQRILILLFFSFLAAFALTYFWVYGNGEVGKND